MAAIEVSWAYILPDPEHSPTARVILVASYVLAAACWLRASRRARGASSGSSSRWWFFGAILLFLLAINKQFDLRTQLAAGIRALAKAEDWYDRRQPMQFVLAIVLPSILAVFAAAFVVTRARVFVRSHPLAPGSHRFAVAGLRCMRVGGFVFRFRHRGIHNGLFRDRRVFSEAMAARKSGNSVDIFQPGGAVTLKG